MKKTFKILSLDGGGVRGYLSILILEKLEKALQKHFKDNKNIYERFDLIVGTSTGGIIATGLAIGKSATEIRELYERLLKKIFTPVNKGYIKPKYNQRILKKEISEILKDKTFNDVKTHLCLTSVDISTSTPRFFKSPYMEKFKSRSDEKLVDAVLATSAAPVFFPIVNTKYSSYLADGGLVANNPTLVGITEGYQQTNDFNKLKVLSIGTGDIKHMPYDVKKIKESGGVISWTLNSKNLTELLIPKKLIIPIIEVLLNTQSNLIDSQAKFLLKDNYIRINPILPTSIDLDEIEKVDILKNLAIEADKEEIIKKVVQLFL